jgi:hypothetical protein
MKQSMILLHGLFGGLSNWTGVINHFKTALTFTYPSFRCMKNTKGIRYPILSISWNRL